MPDSSADLPIRHNADENRFEVQIGTETAVLKYEMRSDTIDLQHTIVPPAIEGEGVGSALAHYALEYARTNSLCVVPTCSFVAAYIQSHPEYSDLTAKT